MLPVAVVLVLCKYSKRKLQSTDYQPTAILSSCLGRIRTLTGGTRIRRATITPQGNVAWGSVAFAYRFFPFAVQSYGEFFN